jgi:transposase-like protein
MKRNNKKAETDLPSDTFNYPEFEKDAIKRLTAGDRLLGKEGVLTGMVQRLVNAALSGEIENHIKSDRSNGISNRRNGYTSKILNTEMGAVPITPPRDRRGEFSPVIVEKWDRHLGTGLEQQILLMYAYGNSYRDIQLQILEIYGLEFSVAWITEVTDRVHAEVATWQQRALSPFYVAIYLDGIYYTSRDSGRSAKKVVYSVFGIDSEGNRDVLGIYIREAEGASEWGLILENLRSRGVEDVLFFCIDGLTGFSEAIYSVFPQSFVQRCIVHMLRSSTKFVARKDSDEVSADLKKIYTAAGEPEARIALAGFEVKWGRKYPGIAKAWEKEWTDLMVFMDFGECIRRMIYTTNPVEGLHRQIRKVTKTKGSWVNDKALVKQIYLILEYGRGGWKTKVSNWRLVSHELRTRFEDRFTKHVEV